MFSSELWNLQREIQTFRSEMFFWSGRNRINVSPTEQRADELYDSFLFYVFCSLISFRFSDSDRFKPKNSDLRLCNIRTVFVSSSCFLSFQVIYAKY